ncbi:putative proton-dependent oligopeptide transporter family, PTR2 family proton/oligopeptide symporter [Helianthus annuus]|nr:putative proton-dependent oligopeptide transporter family, PTR2 family proton/oligopeptide symporter [Helianthus annuus]KAJ0531361.1 putative proton-dependent oligopeptide transporter family, PTR2 family proton/oligopeptide symporter [Helianthus annuus]KAJ0885305.1 putative proton-dependent oligopeptide transporter family, major facilitator superfamily [Helianthus annuus]
MSFQAILYIQERERERERELKMREEMNKQTQTRKIKGGLITMPFIIANEAFEKVASYGLVPNMILYLMNDYKFGIAKGTNIIFLWSAATNFAPILGAFLSDSYLGRFLTIGFGSLFSLLGMLLLWLTTMIPQLKPPHCNQLTEACKPSTHSQFAFLIFAFMFISIGAGGVRPCSLAFGAEQIDNKNNPNNERALESFFGWYYAASAMAVLVAFTVIVYIQEHAGWKVGFGVPMILMLLSVILFFVASSLYIKTKVTKSIFTSFVQVLVAAYKNRKVVAGPPNRWHHLRKDSATTTVPTERFRFLNKACLIQNPKDVTPDGFASNPWRLCTIEQVEELKSLIRVLPLWSSGLMMSINVSQSSFPVLQAKTMDRHLGSSTFQIPPGSFPFFTISTIAIWVILYDRVIIPCLSKILQKQVHLGVKFRMGIGLVISTLAMIISAIVEHIRRKKAIEEGAVVNMSAMWLIPQYCLHGLAEALSAIGQNEFYYSELTKSMSSIAGSLFLVGMGVANLLASVILSAVEKLSRGSGNEGWITSNINEGRYDCYYWVLAIMSFVNLFYFVACSWAYGPCVDEKGTCEDSDEE